MTDRLLRHAKRLLHPWDFTMRRWFWELQGYYRHLSREEFWLRYHEERARAQALEKEGLAAYYDTDWFILRQAYYRRDESYFAVERTLPHCGRLLEFGAGIAPVTAWTMRTRVDADFYVVDLPGARTTEFARYRCRRYLNVYFPTRLPLPVDVVTAFEVLEHVPDAVKTFDLLADCLRPGGVLHLNLTVDAPRGLDLATPEQATEVRRRLREEWDAVVPLEKRPMHGVYVKR